ncbi:MAG: NAD-dependent epimerase/dehydratase family protein, partial [Mycoplasmataceae bacterium]|nr:NAD-dependent epimerase/dehydratase family protein [Mycoplasmataceae bacterium]
MNILLIGGAGYIGSNVSLLLKNKRPEDFVLILDNFSTGTKQALVPDVEWVCADVRDYNQLN